VWAWVEQQMRHPERARKRLEQQRAHDATIAARQQAAITHLETLLAQAEQDAQGYDKAMIRAESEREAAHYQAEAQRARDTASELRERLDAARLALSESDRTVATVDARIRTLSGEFLLEYKRSYTLEERRQWLRDLGIRVEMKRMGSGDDTLLISMAPLDGEPATEGHNVSPTSLRAPR
jgi:hypothetical protein